MPEASPEKGVNVAAASPAAEPQKEAVAPPAESTSVQPKPEPKGFEPSVPYPRFKETNERMKNAESELNALKQKLAHGEMPAKADVSKYSARLTERGLDAKASESLADVMRDVATDAVRDHLSNAERESNARLESMARSEKDVSEWRSNFRKEHKDYAEYEGDMQKAWESLDDGAKMALVSSPNSFNVLYKMVRSDRLDAAKAAGVEEGRQEAYEGKNLKAALSSVPGATAQPSKKFTRADVKAMTTEQFRANEAKIRVDLGY